MNKDFFSTNRRTLIEKNGGGVIVLSAFTRMQRASDYAAQFEQEKNFWWLTGIDAPDWQLIIDGSRHKCWLVAPLVSDINHTFDGSLSTADAIRMSGIDSVVSHDEATDLLHALAKKHSVVYTLGDHPHLEYFDFVLNPTPKKLWVKLDRLFTTVRDCRKDLSALRAIKQSEEISAMRQAIDLTIEGFGLVKKKLPELSYEYEVEAEFSYLFRRRGAAGHAYDPIIAGGKNACTLHYDTNADKLKKRELVMMDVGARHYGYSADITRTYAVGQPTKRQMAVHSAVQSAHHEIVALLRPGLDIREYHGQTDKIMIKVLMGLGLMSQVDDKDAYRTYFPHAISHGLGLDTHDSLGGPQYFQPGMVLTVEPGIYIPKEGIGVRIEDDILITTSGHDNLSGKLSTDL